MTLTFVRLSGRPSSPSQLRITTALAGTFLDYEVFQRFEPGQWAAQRMMVLQLLSPSKVKRAA